jgi:type II secretory pathway component GspD/PulD (secretin)
VTNHVQKLACAVALAAASTVFVGAQGQGADAAGTSPTVPLKVQVVIARYEGEKKISSMPYTLSVNAGRAANLRMGTMVPVVSTSYTPLAPGGAGVNPLTSYNYKDVGTSIDCTTATLDDGRFRMELTVEDSSVYPEDQKRPPGVNAPSFQSFRASNSLVLKDGQTSQFTTAIDKVTGVVTKIDVTLTVVK